MLPPRIIDLTLTLKPGMRGVSFETAMTLARDGWNARTLHLYSHCGTHMDAPHHFGAGSETIDLIPLDRCMGAAWIVHMQDLQPRQLITVDDLGEVASKLQGGQCLLLQTGWSKFVSDSSLYRDGLPRVSEELACWCVERRVMLLGVEPPSVADVNDLMEVTRIHQILLGGGVTIVEGLTGLDAIVQERVFFAACPLKVEAGDGSPCRAFAIEGTPSEGWFA